MSIEIANESGAEVDTDGVLAVARHALDQMGVNPLAELSILLVDVEYMTELNHRWMGGDGPTDVLAFPMDEGSVDHGPGEAGGEPALLGDIVLAPEVAAKQAASAGHSTDDELQLLTVHGALHLLGYDHAEPEEEREMFALQARLLSSWQAARRDTGGLRRRAAEEQSGSRRPVGEDQGGSPRQAGEEPDGSRRRVEE